jgi:nucleoside-diphosphate-sugar epimerase
MARPRKGETQVTEVNGHPKSAVRTSGNGHRPMGARARVTVIGGAGYVGSVLIRAVLDRGYHVTLVDSLLYGDEGINQLYGRPDFELVQDDLREVDAIRRGSRDADAVVHLGGLVGDPACGLDERLTLEINLESTRMIADAVREEGVRRFIFASSCAVYGASEGTLDEGSALDPVSMYARTKMESERVLLGMAGADFAPVMLRFGTFYGLSPRPRFDLVVNLLAAKAVNDGEITILGGDQWRPFVHVEDGSDAIIRCLDAPIDVVTGQVFNVGSDEQNHTLRQVAEIIAAELPGVRVTYEPGAATEANYRVSFGKIRRLLGFVPRRTLAEGVREIAAEIRSGTISDYQATRYSNHKSLMAGGAATLILNGPVLSLSEDERPSALAEDVR